MLFLRGRSLGGGDREAQGRWADGVRVVRQSREFHMLRMLTSQGYRSLNALVVKNMILLIALWTQLLPDTAINMPFPHRTLVSVCTGSLWPWKRQRTGDPCLFFWLLSLQNWCLICLCEDTIPFHPHRFSNQNRKWKNILWWQIPTLRGMPFCWSSSIPRRLSLWSYFVWPTCWRFLVRGI